MSITLSDITNTSTHLSGNRIKVVATTGGIPSGATDYKILLKIVSADNVLFGSPFIDAIAPDDNSEAEFDISGYVDQPVNVDLKWPIPNEYEGRWHGYPNQVYDVQLYAGERYIDSDGNLQESFQAVWGTIFVVKGKLDSLMLARLNELGQTWFTHFSEGGKFLTYMPTTQYIGPDTPVKLWWKSPTTTLAFSLKAKAYYDDGSTVNYSGDGTLWYDVMFEFSVQPRGLQFYPYISGAKLLYYEVWIDSTPNVEKRTFIIDHDYKENNYYLFVDNKIGGIDTIWLNGAVKYNPTGQRTVTSRPFQSGQTTKNRTRFVGGQSRTRKWTINSGFKTKAEMEAIDILLDTQNAWLAIPPADGSTDISQYVLVPVIITSTELDLTDSISDLQSVEIEIEEAY
ncbi:hypothetical protein [Mangrovibacterium sp.]|uniref:hypothetical protein n=1 Tax=Mangrovibacterium sp. TaxID=1961364 RepID=UPI0035614947